MNVLIGVGNILGQFILLMYIYLDKSSPFFYMGLHIIVFLALLISNLVLIFFKENPK